MKDFSFFSFHLLRSDDDEVRVDWWFATWTSAVVKWSNMLSTNETYNILVIMRSTDSTSSSAISNDVESTDAAVVMTMDSSDEAEMKMENEKTTAKNYSNEVVLINSLWNFHSKSMLRRSGWLFFSFVSLPFAEIYYFEKIAEHRERVSNKTIFHSLQSVTTRYANVSKKE